MIESIIKQIERIVVAIMLRRTKISGAQWKSENTHQVLSHRGTYLNRLIRDHLAARLRSR